MEQIRFYTVKKISIHLSNYKKSVSGYFNEFVQKNLGHFVMTSKMFLLFKSYKLDIHSVLLKLFTLINN